MEGPGNPLELLEAKGMYPFIKSQVGEAGPGQHWALLQTMQLEQKQTQNYFQKEQVSGQSTPMHVQDPSLTGAAQIQKSLETESAVFYFDGKTWTDLHSFVTQTCHKPNVRPL